MQQYILALDQGTTSSRAIVFGRDGRAVASAQREFEQILPGPGLVEHDPEAIWDSQLAVAREALAKASLSAENIAAVGVTNQRETTILWDRQTGRPVANAIVWQSRASAGICDRLKAEGVEDIFRAKTGLVVDAYFSGTKIKHLLDTHDGLRARAERGEILFGTVDTWLLWRLTGGKRHVTDYSNASRTLLFDIHTLAVGRRTAPAARRAPRDAARGQAVQRSLRRDRRGVVRASDSVGGRRGRSAGRRLRPELFRARHGQKHLRHRLLHADEYRGGAGRLEEQPPDDDRLGPRRPVTYCLEGSVFIAGAVVQWLRDGLGVIKTSAEVEALAASVHDSDGVYFVPAFVGLGAPHWDSYARGAILGITRGTTAAHIARAALESMAFQLRDLVDAMQLDAGKPLAELRVDGGASVNNALMQFQADLLGVNVRRPVVAETTALGAAYLAGLAVGYWKDLADVAGNWALDRQFQPAISAERRAALYQRWQDAVRRSLDWQQR